MDILIFDGPFRYLSNFYMAPVVYNGVIWTNSEAAYQASKCADSSQMEWFHKLDPGPAKKLGKHIKMRPDWDNVKFQIMYEIVKAKFEQNEDLKYKLLATTGHLEEGNTWGDKIWGTVNREGENNLGKILMRIREEFKGEKDGTKTS